MEFPKTDAPADAEALVALSGPEVLTAGAAG